MVFASLFFSCLRWVLLLPKNQDFFRMLCWSRNLVHLGLGVKPIRRLGLRKIVFSSRLVSNNCYFYRLFLLILFLTSSTPKENMLLSRILKVMLADPNWGQRVLIGCFLLNWLPRMPAERENSDILRLGLSPKAKNQKSLFEKKWFLPSMGAAFGKGWGTTKSTNRIFSRKL